MKLPLFPQDKANHYIYGTVIYVVVSYLFLAVTSLFFPEYKDAMVIRQRLSLAVVFVMAWLKEAVDKYLNSRDVAAGRPAQHGVEFLDAYATILGGIMAYSIDVL